MAHHEVDFLLECGHIQIEPLEAAIFAPLVGDRKLCEKHKTLERIAKVGVPYWVDDTIKEKDLATKLLRRTREDRKAQNE